MVDSNNHVTSPEMLVATDRLRDQIEKERAEAQFGELLCQIAVGVIKYPFRKTGELIDRFTSWLDNLANQYNG
ncbi:MAG: hypothetical protein AAB768_02075 [Patescibacteria group bacterium]